MKQYKITTQDLVQSSENDCFLSPDDPIHELIGQSQLGGLGGDSLLHKYRMSQLPEIDSSNKGKIQRENNIKPGTPEWFQLWFSQNQEN